MALRKERELTQADLGRMLGVSQKTVNHYERRTANPSLELIQRLADVLDVSPAKLLGASEPKAKPRSREKSGPPSQLDRTVERVRGLPRGEQQRIIEMIHDAIARAERRLSG